MAGELVLLINLLHFADPASAELELAELRALPSVEVDRIEPRGLVEYTRAMSGTYPRMRQSWAKSRSRS